MESFTYINFNWWLQPFSHDFDLVSFPPLFCIIILNSIPNASFLMWNLKRGLMSGKPTHFLHSAMHFLLINLILLIIDGIVLLSVYIRELYNVSYTYWSLQSFSQNYVLASHTSHVVRINLVPQWRGLQFDVEYERKIVDKFFHGRFILLSEFLQQIC